MATRGSVEAWPNGIVLSGHFQDALKSVEIAEWWFLGVEEIKVETQYFFSNLTVSIEVFGNPELTGRALLNLLHQGIRRRPQEILAPGRCADQHDAEIHQMYLIVAFSIEREAAHQAPIVGLNFVGWLGFPVKWRVGVQTLVDADSATFAWNTVW